MKEFSKFGYNKSHAIAYARVSFKTAYLKAHYPEEFQEIFKSKEQVVTKEQIVIDNAKELAELQQSSTDVNAAYPEEQIITTKVDTKIGFIEVSGGTSPHCNITILIDNLDKALAIKQADVSARILCMHSMDNIKDYQLNKYDRIIIAYDNNKTDLNSNAILETRNILEEKSLVRIVDLDTQTDFGIKEKIDPIIGKLLLYNDKEVEHIVDYQQLISERTNIDKFFEQNKHIEKSLLQFNPNYNMDQLKIKLEDFKDRTRHKLLIYEQYNEFKPYVINIMQEFEQEKAGSKGVLEYLTVCAREKEFCATMYKNHNDQVILLTQDKHYGLGTQQQIYSRNLTLLEDINKYYHDALKLKVCSLDRLLYEIIEKKQPLHRACENIFARNSEFVVDKIKRDLGNLETYGSVTRDNIKYTNKVDLLNSISNDKILGPYAANCITKEVAEWQKIEAGQKLEQSNQIAEKQQEIAKEPISKSKDF